jgi:magnesium and cobalt transporter
MSGGASRPGLAARLRGLLGWRAPEHSVREYIAELVQEAADAPQQPGMLEELDRHERALIANILRLRGTTADDVMVPRADIVAIAADLSLDAALQLIRAEGHSRLPVYGEDLDDILGMVHIKDVFAYVGSAETFSLRAIMRRPLMVAPQISVLDLLLQMRQARMHLALVVDEYGGIDGLLTIEDLVETIVGDIADEHDEIEGPMVTERPDGTLDVNARMSVEDFEARMGHVLTDAEREADIETVGGLVFTLAGRVPARGEVISHPSGIEFRVLDSDPRHIRRLRVRVPVKATTAAVPAEGKGTKDAQAAAE